MKEFGTLKLISLTKITLSRTNNKVKIQINCQGVLEQCDNRQGDSLSTLLFNTGLKKVVIITEINPCGTIFNRIRKFISYADHTEIIGRTVGVLNEVLTQLQTATVSTGLVINMTKLNT
jgi:hypothetical protein